MQINPSYGYKIKHAESAALAKQIESFLANGGKIKPIEPTYKPKKYGFNNSIIGADQEKPKKLNRTQLQREQFKFLKNFGEVVGFGAWLRLAIVTGVSQTQIGKVAAGKSLFAKQEVWARIQAAANEIMEKQNESK